MVLILPHNNLQKTLTLSTLSYSGLSADVVIFLLQVNRSLLALILWLSMQKWKNNQGCINLSRSVQICANSEGPSARLTDPPSPLLQRAERQAGALKKSPRTVRSDWQQYSFPSCHSPRILWLNRRSPCFRVFCLKAAARRQKTSCGFKKLSHSVSKS